MHATRQTPRFRNGLQLVGLRELETSGRIQNERVSFQNERSCFADDV